MDSARVIQINQEILFRTNGIDSIVMDSVALDAAIEELYDPRGGSIHERAASFLFSVLGNQVLLEAADITSYKSIWEFYQEEGMRLITPGQEGMGLMVGIETDQVDFDTVVEWLENNSSGYTEAFLREANYVSDARETLEESLTEQGENPEDWGDNWEELLDLYVLLLEVKGEDVTPEDVHSAWATYMDGEDPDHKSLVPFEELTEEVQSYDEPFQEAMEDAATKLGYFVEYQGDARDIWQQMYGNSDYPDVFLYHHDTPPDPRLRGSLFGYNINRPMGPGDDKAVTDGQNLYLWSEDLFGGALHHFAVLTEITGESISSLETNPDVATGFYYSGEGLLDLNTDKLTGPTQNHRQLFGSLNMEAYVDDIPVSGVEAVGASKIASDQPTLDDEVFSEEELSSEEGIYSGLYDELSPEEEYELEREFYQAHPEQDQLFDDASLKTSARGYLNQGQLPDGSTYDTPRPSAADYSDVESFKSAVNEWQKGYRRAYKRLKEKERYDLIRNAPGQFPLPKDQWRQILEEFDYSCYWCARSTEEVGTLHQDHYMPATRGGTNHPDNLVPACGVCNSKHGNKTPEEFEEYILNSIERGEWYFAESSFAPSKTSKIASCIDNVVYGVADVMSDEDFEACARWLFEDTGNRETIGVAVEDLKYILADTSKSEVREIALWAKNKAGKGMWAINAIDNWAHKHQKGKYKRAKTADSQIYTEPIIGVLNKVVATPEVAYFWDGSIENEDGSTRRPRSHGDVAEILLKDVHGVPSRYLDDEVADQMLMGFLNPSVYPQQSEGFERLSPGDVSVFYLGDYPVPDAIGDQWNLLHSLARDGMDTHHDQIMDEEYKYTDIDQVHEQPTTNFGKFVITNDRGYFWDKQYPSHSEMWSEVGQPVPAMVGDYKEESVWANDSSDSDEPTEKQRATLEYYFPGREIYWGADGLSDFDPVLGIKTAGARSSSDGVMIALVPPDEVRAAFEMEGGEDWKNHHITLVYLQDLSPDTIDTQHLIDDVENWYRDQEQPEGKPSGFGVFHNDENHVLYVGWDIKGIDDLRSSLCQMLEDELWSEDCDGDHGLQPHQTLFYDSEEIISLPEWPEGVDEVVPLKLVVAIGGEWYEIGDDTVKTSGYNWAMDGASDIPLEIDYQKFAIFPDGRQAFWPYDTSHADFLFNEFGTEPSPQELGEDYKFIMLGICSGDLLQANDLVPSPYPNERQLCRLQRNFPFCDRVQWGTKEVFFGETSVSKIAKRDTIAIDFDGVIHQYEKWTGNIPENDPEEGALDFIYELLEDGCEVIIFSTRAATFEGKMAIKDWLEKHDFPPMEVTSEKPPAKHYIDDNAIHYDGDWDEVRKEIKTADYDDLDDEDFDELFAEEEQTQDTSFLITEDGDYQFGEYHDEIAEELGLEAPEWSEQGSILSRYPETIRGVVTDGDIFFISPNPMNQQQIPAAYDVLKIISDEGQVGEVVVECGLGYPKGFTLDEALSYFSNNKTAADTLFEDTYKQHNDPVQWEGFSEVIELYRGLSVLRKDESKPPHIDNLEIDWSNLGTHWTDDRNIATHFSDVGYGYGHDDERDGEGLDKYEVIVVADVDLANVKDDHNRILSNKDIWKRYDDLVASDQILPYAEYAELNEEPEEHDDFYDWDEPFYDEDDEGYEESETIDLAELERLTSFDQVIWYLQELGELENLENETGKFYKSNSEQNSFNWEQELTLETGTPINLKAIEVYQEGQLVDYRNMNNQITASLKTAESPKVEEKAKKIYDGGGVKFISVTPDPEMNVATMEFDVRSTSGSTYPVYCDVDLDMAGTLIDPKDAQCNCDFAKWNYDRSAPFKHLEGLVCSHIKSVEHWLDDHGEQEINKALQDMDQPEQDRFDREPSEREPQEAPQRPSEQREDTYTPESTSIPSESYTEAPEMQEEPSGRQLFRDTGETEEEIDDLEFDEVEEPVEEEAPEGEEYLEEETEEERTDVYEYPDEDEEILRRRGSRVAATGGDPFKYPLDIEPPPHELDNDPYRFTIYDGGGYFWTLEHDEGVPTHYQVAQRLAAEAGIEDEEQMWQMSSLMFGINNERLWVTSASGNPLTDSDKEVLMRYFPEGTQIDTGKRGRPEISVLGK